MLFYQLSQADEIHKSGVTKLNSTVHLGGVLPSGDVCVNWRAGFFADNFPKSLARGWVLL
jgi:hypothetical protein